MPDDQANSNEGADPTDDIKKQNSGEVVTEGQSEQGNDDPARAGAGNGPDADADEYAADNDDQHDTEAEDLTKAGREGFDPNDGRE